MPEEVNAGAGAGAGAGTGGSGGSSAPAAMTAAEIAAPGGDVAFLEQDTPSGMPPAEIEAGEAGAGKGKGAGAEGDKGDEAEDINLAALEEGKPTWLAKLTPEEREQAEKDMKAGGLPENWQFKDEADREEFFKSLPGGREQVAALQMLSQEIAEQDSAIEANTPEGNSMVVEKSLSMAPDGGIGLLRAAAQHMAKQSPEAWKQVSHELINSSLRAAGIGADFAGVVTAIRELKAAYEADDGEAFGAAAGKLLGAPRATQAEDPALKAAADREAANKAEQRQNQTERWQMASERSGTAIDTHITGQISETLKKVLPEAIGAQDRTKLSGEIMKEVYSQLFADTWIAAQLKSLIGYSLPGPKGTDYGNALITASQDDWDKATAIMTKATTPKLVARAVSKIVTAWSRERASTNAGARAAARVNANRTDVGGGKTAGTGKGRQPLTEEQLKKMSDAEFLSY